MTCVIVALKRERTTWMSADSPEKRALTKI